MPEEDKSHSASGLSPKHWRLANLGPGTRSKHRFSGRKRTALTSLHDHSAVVRVPRSDDLCQNTKGGFLLSAGLIPVQDTDLGLARVMLRAAKGGMRGRRQTEGDPRTSLAKRPSELSWLHRALSLCPGTRSKEHAKLSKGARSVLVQLPKTSKVGGIIVKDERPQYACCVDGG
ncbi:hypothetical protein C8Q79DRAFT_61797 [Trametes meyenii]|nr:hypothetical protein C8Q79DRAFT_61797 [Trametes meyenii]